MISAAEKDAPGCPEPASAMPCIASILTSLIFRLSSRYLILRAIQIPQIEPKNTLIVIRKFDKNIWNLTQTLKFIHINEMALEKIGYLNTCVKGNIND
jgi:hypothetical protein